VTATPPEPPKAVPVKTDALAAIVARRMGWDLAMLQASPTLLLALMLIVIEIPLWPLAAYFWRRGPLVVGPVPAAYAAVEADPPRGGTVGPAEPQKALPAPQAAVAIQSEDVWQPDPEPPPARPAKPPQAIARQPISEEARAALDASGYPWVRLVGELLERESPEASAQRFALWLRAFGLHGEHGSERMDELYQQCCAEYHREPVPWKHGLASALDNRRLRVTKTTPTKDGKRLVVWVVRAWDTKRKDQRIEAHKPESLPHNRLGHLTPSKQAEHIADIESRATEVRPAGRVPFSVAPVLSVALAGRRPDGLDLFWLRQQRKQQRAERIAMTLNRKQRGSRVMGRVA
jgi:hypothetical protein